MHRQLIVNADDLGQSPGVNRGILQAHRSGIVTSASLMVRWPDAAQAAALARECPGLSVGLHLDFGEWTLRDGQWVALYEVVPLDDGLAVEAEIGRQIDRFRHLLGRPPTHLDSHQHVHRRSPARELALAAARALDVPLRGTGPIRYCGSFYGQTEAAISQPEAVGVDALLSILADLGEGCTELGCHPAADDDLDTMYGNERLHELRTLCDPRIPAALAQLGIELISFGGAR